MTEYYIHGLQVCQKTFMFLHCISHKKLENLVQHYDETTDARYMHTWQCETPFKECSLF